MKKRPAQQTNPLFRTVLVGFISSSIMTLVMQQLYNRLPRSEQYPLPPEEISTVVEIRILGKRLSQPSHMALTLLSHFGYGITLAGVYAATVGRLPFVPFLKGVLYGIGVWAGSYMGWLPALGILKPATEFPRERNRLMIIAHLVWGATLGILTDKLYKSTEQK